MTGEPGGRICCWNSSIPTMYSFSITPVPGTANIGGDEGIRTPDPLVANEVLSQLSHAPTATDIITHYIPPNQRKSYHFLFGHTSWWFKRFHDSFCRNTDARFLIFLQEGCSLFEHMNFHSPLTPLTCLIFSYRPSWPRLNPTYYQ